MYQVFLVVLLSCLPIFEIRGAIPLALSFGFNDFQAFSIAYIGSVLMIPIVFKLWTKAFELSCRVDFVKQTMHKLSERTLKKSSLVDKFSVLGLALFVAVPLPGTGIWSGALLAKLMKIDRKKSIIALALGDFIAGFIVLMVSEGVILMF